MLGCGPSAPAGARPTAPVTVTVKYKGAPVEGASIMFVTPGGEANPGVGLTDASGTAKLRTYVEGDGAIIGSHKVVISKSETTGGAPSVDQDSAAYVSPDENAPPPPPVVVKHHVPQKYSTPGTTDLTAEVKSGKNEFTFDLQD
jgi:hypothetical protein